MDGEQNSGEAHRYHFRAEEAKRDLWRDGRIRYPIGSDAEANIRRIGSDFYFADLYVGGNRVESQDRSELASLLEWAHQTARKYR